MRLIFLVLWLAWGVFWIAKSRGIKAVERSATRDERLGPIIPLCVASGLIALPELAVWQDVITGVEIAFVEM